MGEISTHQPVLLICAMISRYPDALRWGIDQLIAAYGPVALESPVYDFTETSYYNASMGDDLKKQFVAFETLVAPDAIVDAKRATNQLEQDYIAQHSAPEERPLNLDPGYISQAKLVLATTKDRDHRLYMSKGIYAEVTLFFRKKEWCSSRWTYPDYQREDFQEYFSKCRLWLKERYRTSRS